MQSSQAAKIVYGLLCPDTMTCRYVGVARNFNKRFGEHCRLSNNHENTKRQAWLRSLLHSGKKPIGVILQDEAIDFDGAERRWISYFRSYATEKLTNGNDGGADLSHANDSPRSNRARGRRSILSQILSEFAATANGQAKYASAEHREKAKRFHREITEIIRQKRLEGSYQEFSDKVERTMGSRRRGQA